MEKQKERGQSFKHQLWDLDEECHFECETEFEAAVGPRVVDSEEQILQPVRFFGALTRVWFQPAFAWKPVERTIRLHARCRPMSQKT